MRDDTAVILIDHGSKNPQVHDSLEQMAALVAGKLGLAVAAAHMTAAQPSLEAAAAALAAEGVRNIVVMPYFLFGGQHAGEDIPALLAAAEKRYPHVAFRLADPLGADEALAELVVRRITPLLPESGQ